jgi:alpha-mannosidase/alpha-mannosidase II/lysosomal alpha-mannosidase
LEQAVIKMRFSPKLFKELVQFQVELNSLPTGDLISRDVTVNWKMYGGFDPNDTFFTDSNGLEMQKRAIDHYDRYQFKGRESRIPRNFYPVNGAIAMRDANGSSV